MGFRKFNEPTLIILVWLMLFTLNASAQTDSDSKPVKGVQINKKPLNDFADSVVEEWLSGEVDLAKPFSVKFKGSLNENGRLDREKTEFIAVTGDKTMIRVAVSGIQTVSDSGFLQYLNDLEIQDLETTIALDNDNFSIKLTSQTKSKNEARTLASVFNGLISVSKLLLEKGDEKILLESIGSPRSDGSMLIIDFSMPIKTYRGMVNRNLSEASVRKR